jgi:hypothetical protein
VSLYLRRGVIIRIGRIIGYRGHRFAPGAKADGEKGLIKGSQLDSHFSRLYISSVQTDGQAGSEASLHLVLP